MMRVIAFIEEPPICLPFRCVVMSPRDRAGAASPFSFALPPDRLRRPGVHVGCVRRRAPLSNTGKVINRIRRGAARLRPLRRSGTRTNRAERGDRCRS